MRPSDPIAWTLAEARRALEQREISARELTRAFLAWDPDSIDEVRASELELEKYDLLLSPAPVAGLPCLDVRPALAEQDLDDAIDRSLAGQLRDDLTDAIDAAARLERTLTAHAG